MFAQIPHRVGDFRCGLYAHRVTNVTLYIERSDGSVTLAAASIATGWSETSSRAGLSPLLTSAFHGALEIEARLSQQRVRVVFNPLVEPRVELC